MADAYVLDQIGCARCDGDGHPGLMYLPFTRPIEMGDGGTATHWALCPTLGEPILVVAYEKADG